MVDNVGAGLVEEVEGVEIVKREVLRQHFNRTGAYYYCSSELGLTIISEGRC